MTNLDRVPPWGPLDLMPSPVSSVSNGDPTLLNPRSVLRGPRGESRAAPSLLFCGNGILGLACCAGARAHGVYLARPIHAGWPVSPFSLDVFS